MPLSSFTTDAAFCGMPRQELDRLLESVRRDYGERQEARLAAEMKRLKRNPSNRYLAGVLGLPRGNVNSSLARMKKRLYALKNEDSTSDIE